MIKKVIIMYLLLFSKKIIMILQSFVTVIIFVIKLHCEYFLLQSIVYYIYIYVLGLRTFKICIAFTYYYELVIPVI